MSLTHLTAYSAGNFGVDPQPSLVSFIFTLANIRFRKIINDIFDDGNNYKQKIGMKMPYRKYTNFIMHYTAIDLFSFPYHTNLSKSNEPINAFFPS